MLRKTSAGFAGIVKITVVAGFIIDLLERRAANRGLTDHPGSVDMLVPDVLMPGMTGRELYEHLARRHPGLKVLYVSGCAGDAFGREPGWGTSFLSKPFSLETFAHRVRDVLRTV